MCICNANGAGCHFAFLLFSDSGSGIWQHFTTMYQTNKKYNHLQHWPNYGVSNAVCSGDAYLMVVEWLKHVAYN
jgi:hypothetical protein